MRRRRAIVLFITGVCAIVLLGGAMPRMIEEGISVEVPSTTTETSQSHPTGNSEQKGSAAEALESLQVKGRAPKTGYDRSEFSDGWAKVNGCSTRDIILYRDLEETVLDGECTIVSGILNDPYTGERIEFSKTNSSKVQIDHVVALSDAWQKGAQQLTKERRKQLANDPLELLAVDGQANQQKSDGDAATWLPKNKAFRCQYVARQIAIKQKYELWVTQAEKEAMTTVLSGCQNVQLPA